MGINALVVMEGRFRRAPVLLSGLALGCVGLAAVAAARPALLPRFRPPGPSNLATLRDCLRPTATPEEMLQPTTDPEADAILKSVREIKGRLDENAVKERKFLVYHRAAEVYHLLGRKLPTKYYSLGWAAIPEMERDLIEELERNHVRAFLQVEHIGGAMSRMGDTGLLPHPSRPPLHRRQGGPGPPVRNRRSAR